MARSAPIEAPSDGRFVLASALAALSFCACETRGTSPSDGLPIVRGEARKTPPSAHPGVFRIVDWNIRAGRSSSIAAITDKLSSLQADLIVLQELDRGAHRTADVDEPAVIAHTLGYDYVFAPIIPWDGGDYGIATFSRIPFASVERIALSNQYADEPRGALRVSVCPSRKCLHAINHHADTVTLAAATSTNEILATLVAQPGNGFALLGDLNQIASDQGPEACLRAGFVDLGAEYDGAPTEGDRRIDYAFVDAALAACVEAMHIEPVTESDHNALLVDLSIACLEANLD